MTRPKLVVRDRSLKVDRDKTETVVRNKIIHVTGNHNEKIDGSMTYLVGKTLTETVLSIMRKPWRRHGS